MYSSFFSGFGVFGLQLEIAMEYARSAVFLDVKSEESTFTVEALAVLTERLYLGPHFFLLFCCTTGKPQILRNRTENPYMN